MKGRVQLYRLSRVADRTVEYETDSLTGPPAAAAALHEFLKDLPTEHLVVAHLNTHMQLIGIEIVSAGSLDATVATAADIFRGAIVAGAKSIVLAHNHPSGNQEPSDADVALTARIKDAGTILGIALQDHLVITPTSITSMRTGTIITKTSKPSLDDLSMFDVEEAEEK